MDELSSDDDAHAEDGRKKRGRPMGSKDRQPRVKRMLSDTPGNPFPSPPSITLLPLPWSHLPGADEIMCTSSVP